MHAEPQSLGASLLFVAAALVLVGANALFVAAEFALVSVRPGRLRALVRQGNRRAARALYLVQHLDATLSVCQVGITLASLGLGWLGEPAFAKLFAALFSPAASWIGPAALSASFVAAFLLITMLHVVLGELVPKSVAIALAEPVAVNLAFPLRAFWLASWPLVALLNRSAWLILKPFGLARAGTETMPHSAEEIRTILARSALHGQIGALQAALVENLFRFARGRARDVMVPRSRVVALDLTRPLPELLARVQEEGYSRYPLMLEDLDHLVGILHVKDLFPALAAGTTPDLRKMARPPLVVPENLRLERLLLMFQQARSHMAIVADEYGGTTGIVALEDVLEELVGELRDEFDVGEVDPVRARPGGGFILDPGLPASRAAELVRSAPEVPENVHTVAGLLQSELGHVPKAGEKVPFGDHELVASAVHGTRVTEVQLVPTAPADRELPEEEA
ncbi:MAG: HlyC/CorC family transporter [Acidobacteria bacterium]|nr:HlyC/CorC family transporter [Acidobacteriota bacterium]